MQIINVSLAKAYENVNSQTNSKIPWEFPDIPVKTEFPDIPWFSRKWEQWQSGQLYMNHNNTMITFHIRYSSTINASESEMYSSRVHLFLRGRVRVRVLKIRTRVRLKYRARLEYYIATTDIRLRGLLSDSLKSKLFNWAYGDNVWMLDT